MKTHTIYHPLVSLTLLDLNKTIEARIVPGQPGFHGELKIVYGPISLDQLVQHRLIGSIKAGTLELNADGSVNTSQLRFDTIKATREDIEFIDKHNNSTVSKEPITREIVTRPSQQDSLMTTVRTPSKGTLL